MTRQGIPNKFGIYYPGHSELGMCGEVAVNMLRNFIDTHLPGRFNEITRAVYDSKFAWRLFDVQLGEEETKQGLREVIWYMQESGLVNAIEMRPRMRRYEEMMDWLELDHDTWDKMSTFYFNTGVVPHGHRPPPITPGPGQLWRGGTLQIRFMCPNVPDGAELMFLFPYPDHPRGKLENVIVRMASSGDSPTDGSYAYFKLRAQDG